MNNYIQRIRILGRKPLLKKYYRAFSSETEQQSTTETPVGGYAKAFDKFENIKTEEAPKLQTFASLLRNSKFIDVIYMCRILYFIYL